ncbi:MAG: SemiSWEET family sugar transporter [Candidatus Omnitrophota bacterium]
MNYIDIFGLVAGALTTGSFLPQIIKIYRTKKTEDLSLGMYAILTLGIFLWAVYGVASHTMPIVAANSLATAFCVYILAMKIRYG